MATQAVSLDATRILLNRSLENIIECLKSIENHDDHNGPFGSDVLVLNTVDANKVTRNVEIQDIKEKIDISLISYEASLQTVVETVNCDEALAFATRIFENCEQQLLKENLSEAKKYYNFRTKQITEEALKLLAGCSK